MYKNLPRLVPWTNWEEWVEIRELLFSSDKSDVAIGLKRVACWEVRGRVPVAVSATAAILSAFGLNNSSDLVIRQLLSIAIVRFVNGTVDVGQKGLFARSVGDIADEISMPRLLVDIRHESAHGSLPTLPILRLAAKQALDWLQKNYWKRQQGKLLEAESSLHDLLKRYYAARKSEIRDESLGTENSDRTLQQIANVMTPNSVSALLVPQLVTSGVMLHAKESLALKSSVLPPVILQLWQPLLALCSATWPHFLPAISIALCDRLCTGRDVQPESLRDESVSVETELRMALHWLLHFCRNETAALPMLTLAKQLLLSPNEWTLDAVKTLTDEGLVVLPADSTARLQRMLDAIETSLRPTAAAADAALTPNSTAPSLDDLEAFLHKRKAKVAQSAAVPPVVAATLAGEVSAEDILNAGPRVKRIKAPGTSGPGPAAWERIANWQPCALGTTGHAVRPSLALPFVLDADPTGALWRATGDELDDAV